MSVCAGGPGSRRGVRGNNPSILRSMKIGARVCGNRAEGPIPGEGPILAAQVCCWTVEEILE